MENDQPLSDEQSTDGFTEGFDGTTETPVLEPKAEEPKTDDQPAPEFVQITKQEWEDLRARAAVIDEVRDAHGKKIDSMSGSLGVLRQVVDGLKSSSSTGAISDEDWAQLESEYPDLAELNAFKKLRGAGTTPPALDEAQLGELVDKRVAPLKESVRREIEMDNLADEHADWREVVGIGDDGKPIQTPYREWLAKQPAEYQAKVASSWRARVVGESISKFKAAQAAAAKAAAATSTRQSRLAAAVPVRGDVAVTSSDAGEDEFEKGYNEAR